MKSKPQIGSPDQHDFHDSHLHQVEISPQLDWIKIAIETSILPFEGRMWNLTFEGVLQFDFKTSGIGVPESYPIEIYDIYIDHDSSLSKLWNKRLIALEAPKTNIFHVILGSSFYCDWDWDLPNKLEGISIICTGFSIE